MSNPAVAYLRVSTKQQGMSGLGIEAQREAVREFCEREGYHLVNGREYVEVESGTKKDRPQLHRVLASCRAYKATLIVARLDRLSRNAAFLMTLHDRGVDVRACDMPTLTRLMLGVLSLLAQEERDLISQRTKAALAAAKARGVKLGGDRGATVSAETRAKSAAIRQARSIERARDALGHLDGWQDMRIQIIADRLNGLAIPTASGTGTWDFAKAQRAKALAS